MDIQTIDLNSSEYPDRLRTIHSPPKRLFTMGAPLAQIMNRKSVAVVGSRKISNYGKYATYEITRDLADQGIVIVSGLAFGVDAEAHRAALAAGGLTVAVLPSPITDIYPTPHYRLAMQIVEAGGCLVSEYDESLPNFKSNFVARNRIVAGLSDIVLITEAEKKSGSHHTATFAVNTGRTVMAVPGNITSPSSVGTNNLLKDHAIAATSAEDVLIALGMTIHKTKIKHVKGSNPGEQSILNVLLLGITAGHEILAASGLSVSHYNQHLTMLEIRGKIRPLGSDNWMIA